MIRLAPRPPGGEVPRSATVLELLFDIVYVFALARLAGRIADDLTIVRHTLLSEAGQTILFFVAMWMIWSINAVTSSIYDPRSPTLQVELVATMFGTLILAVSLPQAFGERGVIFAVTYVLLQVLRPLHLALALRRMGGTAWRAPVRVLCWHTVSGTFWLTGAAGTGVTRGVLWTIAVGIEVLGMVTAWAVPRLGTNRRKYEDLVYHHLAERYNQFFMIALAEVVLETGAAVSFPGLSVDRTIVLVAAFLTVVAYWRIYFYHRSWGRSEHQSGTGPAMRLTDRSNFSLLLIVGGVICSAVGFGQIVREADPPIDWALVVVIFGGSALFLIGRAFLERELHSVRRSMALYVGLLALGVAAPITLRFPPMVAAVAVAVVMVGVALFDELHRHSGREGNPTL
ncbi:low temperature requirement protein A [Micromonospora sp. WP24]|uniref:low temperature requirement protein A n=1 Tax=Micromonospora sp. WP24 TaxID=2604469 RepID=UPI0011D41F18|nr:low temperature requirement protein A [Micromonospora sp. WP24]TYC05088.1 low temperature requirement protein A [Micromonospora sp. WP24]